MDLGLTGSERSSSARRRGSVAPSPRRWPPRARRLLWPAASTGAPKRREQIGAARPSPATSPTPGDGARIVDDAVAALGGLDICVVNTGGGKPGPITATTAADDLAAYHAMLRPTLEVGRAAAPHLAAGGRGRLVFLTARSVVEATPDLALSSVMRSGVARAARSLALELAPDVLVNVVVTGQFDTPALGRFEAAKAAAAGCQPATSAPSTSRRSPSAAWALRASSPTS